MPLLAALLPPKPLFVAKLVRVELSPGTYIADARRDLTAVGFSELLTTDTHHRESLLIFRGRPAFRAGTGDDKRPTVEPVAIVGRNRFVLAIARRQAVYDYREATVAQSGYSFGRRVAKPRLSRPPQSKERSTSLRFSQKLWPADLQGWQFEPVVDVSWWRLRTGVQVGSGRAWTSAGADNTGHDHSVGVSFAARPGGDVEPLATVVKAPRGSPIREILWVSPEGWLVVRAGDHALAWLYPTKH